MGVFWTIVNPVKKQFLDIEAFGEHDKRPLMLYNHDGSSIHALALACLLSHSSHFSATLFGSWSGDAVYVPNDHNEADENGFSCGIHTATDGNPKQSLYHFAFKNYTNISVPIIDALCQWDVEVLRVLVTRATARYPSYSLCKALVAVFALEGGQTLHTFKSVYKNDAEAIHNMISHPVYDRNA